MTFFGLLLTLVLLPLMLNEFSDVSPWLARRMVAWSARIKYGDDPRAEIQAEAWAAVINDRPGKLFKLATGLWWLSDTLAEYLWRLIAGEPRPNSDIHEQLSSLPRPDLPLEVIPSRLIGRFLFPTEKFRGEWRRHWIHLVKSLAIIAIYAVLGALATERRIKPRYVDGIVTIIVVAAILLAAYRVLLWYVTRFVITNKRLMTSEGILRRRVAMLPLQRVTDIRYTQTPMAQLLNYGTFTLESASRRNTLRKIVHLPNPNELYLRLVEEMYEPEAVEARLSRAFSDDADEQSRLDPVTIQAEVLRHVAVLTTRLDALSTALSQLAPARPPAEVDTASAATELAPPSAGDDGASGRPHLRRTVRTRIDTPRATSAE